MEGYYEICVSLDGRHVFATAPRSIRTKADLARVWAHMVAAFGGSDYKLTVTHWQAGGFNVEGYPHD